MLSSATIDQNLSSRGRYTRAESRQWRAALADGQRITRAHAGNSARRAARSAQRRSEDIAADHQPYLRRAPSGRDRLVVLVVSGGRGRAPGRRGLACKATLARLAGRGAIGRSDGLPDGAPPRHPRHGPDRSAKWLVLGGAEPPDPKPPMGADPRRHSLAHAPQPRDPAGTGEHRDRQHGIAARPAPWNGARTSAGGDRAVRARAGIERWLGGIREKRRGADWRAQRGARAAEQL